MQWQILVGPLIGAIIGYVTNKIAVEMLFHPLKPIYIGKFKVPFTPGIIPKGKERLGKAIGDAVGNDLLTPAVIKQSLLSSKMKQDIEEQLDILFNNITLDSSSLESKLQKNIGELTTTHLEIEVKQALAKKVTHGLVAMNLGELVATEVLAAVQAKIQGTMLSMMLNASTLTPITEEIKIRVNQYMEENSETKVNELIQVEFSSFMEQPVSHFLTNRDTNELKQIILNLYVMVVNNYADQVLNTLDFSKIVQDKVSAMEVKEVQDLVLSIMKNELGAVVNLGALIGFILGIANIFF